ncbi:MAG: hypothetical protein IPG50_19825 [Myxococcales bacterium]|nr:hypothetical protein [Myxococcales bacterium]
MIALHTSASPAERSWGSAPKHPFAVLALVVLCATTATPARAQQDRPLAEKLFLEGRTLTQKGEHAAACEKFRASYELDKTATGTLLNLALCNETIGKAASAWAQFRQVAAESLGRREDRVTLAREHEAKVFPSVSYVTLRVPAEARTDGLRVLLDGRPLAEAAFGSEVPVDPGTHVIEVSAPNKRVRMYTAVVGPTADRQLVSIAPLEDESSVPPDTLTPLATPVQPAHLSMEAPPAPRSEAPRIQRGAGVALMAGGGASVAVGLVFGAVAISKNQGAKDLCPSDRCPTQSAKDDASERLQSAHDAAVVANVAVAAGAVLGAAGAFLFFTAKSSAPSAGRALFRAATVPLAGGAAVVVGGAL